MKFIFTINWLTLINCIFKKIKAAFLFKSKHEQCTDDDSYYNVWYEFISKQTHISLSLFQSRWCHDSPGTRQGSKEYRRRGRFWMTLTYLVLVFFWLLDYFVLCYQQFTWFCVTCNLPGSVWPVIYLVLCNL